MYVVELMDTFATAFPLLAVAFCECVVVNWIYGQWTSLSVMPIHTTGGFPAVRCFSWRRTAPRLPHFVRVVHTTGGWPLIGHGFFTINNNRMTVLQTLVTEKQPSLT